MDLLSFIPAGYGPYIALGLIVLVGLKLISAIMSPKAEGSSIWIEKRCHDCGWKGTVSKHHPVCRKCNSSI